MIKLEFIYFLEKWKNNHVSFDDARSVGHDKVLASQLHIIFSIYIKKFFPTLLFNTFIRRYFKRWLLKDFWKRFKDFWKRSSLSKSTLDQIVKKLFIKNKTQNSTPPLRFCPKSKDPSPQSSLPQEFWQTFELTPPRPPHGFWTVCIFELN
jgi:hypothetical protein